MTGSSDTDIGRSEPGSTSNVDSPLERIRSLIAAGRTAEAEVRLALLITSLFDLRVSCVTLNRDGYSLNSANGTVLLFSGETLFFKFHQEEGEETTVGEYYRAELLDEAGFPVDRPIHVSQKPGRQILLYAKSTARRFADVCLDWERAHIDSVNPEYLSAQEALDRLVTARYLETLHTADPEQSKAEPIHQLFHGRLVDAPRAKSLGGRYRRFYAQSRQRFVGPTGREIEIPWETFGSKTWLINGVRYKRSLDDLFTESLTRLAPEALAAHPAVTAHGDAHNANIWFRPQASQPLVFFDPAFAGRDIPALLAEIKPTFHNIFAHPFWLYHPDVAEKRLTATIRIDGDTIVSEHSWHLSALRKGFLAAKVETLWTPLLRRLKERGELPEDWRRILRCALFCCPTLVMNLSVGAGNQNPLTSAVGWSVAMMMGAEPEGGRDDLTLALDKMSP